MSKPSAKKAARQRRKQQKRTRTHVNHLQQQRVPSVVVPTFPAERLGVPSALYGWVGRKVTSIFKLHR